MSTLYAPATTLTLSDYLRVSKDSSGRERSPQEQHADHLDMVEHTPGFEWADRMSYGDVGSASRFAAKDREGWDELISDLAAGRFVADALLLWVNSRGSRKVGEWVVLLDILAEQGKKIVIATHGGRVYDPAGAKDRHTLLEDANDAELEAGKISEAVRRAMRANAAAGKVQGGRRPFGYSHDGRTIDHAEAAIVREMAERVLGGESMRSLAMELNTRGVPTASGGTWHPTALRQVLGGTRIAGLRVHHGRVQMSKDDPTVPVTTEWPAIISMDTHRRLVATLAAKPRVGSRGRTPWLLTGILHCGKCGASLVGNVDSPGNSTGQAGTRRYQCRKGPGYHGCGGLGIKADDVEELLGEVVTQRLGDPEARRGAMTGPDDGDELAELDAIAAERIAVADSRLSLDAKAAEHDALDRRHAAVQAALASKQRSVNGPLALCESQGLLGRPWKSLEHAEKRLVLDSQITRVDVAPASVRGSKAFEAARVNTPGRITWRA